jgi:crotonobetainyl-CoA:carnitine CoA-transferase CaiB-like acyl-CoA transferase
MDVEIGGKARGPLAGIRVVDFSGVVSGPLCAQIMGDLGADIVKVEPRFGDTSRRLGPPFRAGQSATYLQFNRNKRSLALDLKSEAGVEVARRLARDADVVIENYRPGVADRLGIGYEVLRIDNPGLIYVAISGFGPEGPYADHPAYDTVIQGLSGYMSVQGDEGDPKLVRSIAADKTSGLTAAYAAMAALFARERNEGRGQRVDVPMLDAYAAFMMSDCLGNEVFVPAEQSNFPLKPSELHRSWKTADGHVVMMIVEDSQFQGICRAVDREDLIDDPRSANIIARITNIAELFGILEQEVAKWPTAELVERARRFGAPLAPANTVEEFLADPQVAANRTVFEVDTGREIGTLRMLRNPVRFEQTPTSVRAFAPNLGENSDEVLAELGYSADDIAALRESQTVG